MGDAREGTEQSLLDSEKSVTLAEIPLHSTNLLTVLDPEGIVRYESPAIERLFGFDQQELIGQRVADYFHEADRDGVMSAFETVVRSEDDLVETVEYRHAVVDGSYLWVESVASSSPTPSGYYVVNTRDISHRRTREQQLKRANERLSEFASIVSHDLRSPLNVAEAHLELARDTSDTAHLDGISDAHKRMETLIEDLLVLAQSGEVVGEPEIVDLREISRLCWNAVDTQEASLNIATDIQLSADRTRLQQLLENLFRNAIEHGGTDVNVVVGELETGFFVEDSGSGIPTADRDQIYDAGTSSIPGGTGLGLTIVKRIAEAHGWTIQIAESNEGGARLEFSGVDRS